MKIDLNGKEVYEILRAKFGDADYRLFFFENEAGRTRRTGEKLHMNGVAPADRTTSVYLSEEETMIP